MSISYRQTCVTDEAAVKKALDELRRIDQQEPEEGDDSDLEDAPDLDGPQSTVAVFPGKKDAA